MGSNQASRFERRNQRGFTRLQVVGMALAGFALLVGLVWLFYARFASDEPPIRVRGGSMNAEIVTAANARWRPGNNTPADRNNFYVESGGENDKEMYYVKLKRAGGECDSRPIPEAKRVEVDHHRDAAFDVHHLNKKTRITTKGGVVLTTNPKVVDYRGIDGQYVDGLRLFPSQGGQPWECKFTAKGQFIEVCLCTSESACSNYCN
jgi:hypothetical protein